MRVFLVSCSLVLMVCCSTAYSQTSANMPVNSQLYILSPLAISCAQPMIFPDVISGYAVAGLVADYGGEAGLSYTSFNAAQPASCIATGEVDSTVCVSVDNATFNMDVEGHTYPVALTPSASTLTLVGGSAAVDVSGSMDWDGITATPDTYYSVVGEITVTYDCNSGEPGGGEPFCGGPPIACELRGWVPMCVMGSWQCVQDLGGGGLGL